MAVVSIPLSGLQDNVPLPTGATYGTNTGSTPDGLWKLLGPFPASNFIPKGKHSFHLLTSLRPSAKTLSLFFLLQDFKVLLVLEGPESYRRALACITSLKYFELKAGSSEASNIIS